jgi:Na+-translocating ferredoxin:NAD+ oxidoreductase RnfA subunit
MRIFEYFSTKNVLSKLTSNLLSQGQLFSYFYFVTLYDAIVFVQQWLNLAKNKPSSSDIVNIWLYLLITAVGLLVLFFVNGGNNGKDFLQKFFSFSFTVGVKYALVMLLFSMCYPFYLYIDSSPYNIIVNVIMNVLLISNIALRIYQTNKNERK